MSQARVAGAITGLRGRRVVGRRDGVTQAELWRALGVAE
jgi:hypothetical protein